MNRRAFFVSTTAATVASGAAVWYAYDGQSLYAREDGPYSAWRQWNDPADPALVRLIKAAVLASSPHNTQPWRFRVGGNSVELFLDARRSVAGLDPYLREAHIGMGCALENLLLSAAANGLAGSISVPEGQLEAPPPGRLRLVAWVDLSPGSRRETDLYTAIPNRHTNRGAYDPAVPLPGGFTGEMLSLCNVEQDARLFLFTDRARRDELTRISTSANREIYSDNEVETGNNQWIRWRSGEIEELEDGITVDNFGLPPVTAALAKAAPTFLLKQAATPSQRSKMYEPQMRSARLIGIIAVRDRLSMSQSLVAGRLWQRAHLLATARGAAARPCNEAIEMIDYEQRHGSPANRLRELTSVIGDAAWRPTFLFLMGKPTLEAGLSPRRSLNKVIFEPEFSAYQGPAQPGETRVKKNPIADS